MTTARVFKSGNSQAVRLPKQFRFNTSEIEIFQRGNEVVLREKAKGMTAAFLLLAELGECLPQEDRIDPPPQKRKGL